MLRAAPSRRVVGALRNLPGNYKELWKEMLFLDQGPDGCFAKTDVLAFRTGLTPGTVKKYRQTLQKLGMLEGEDRREGRRWVWHWYPTLPVDCVPPRGQLNEEEIAMWRDRLEQHIESVRGNPSSPSSNGDKPARGGTPVPLHETLPAVMRGVRGSPSRIGEGEL